MLALGQGLPRDDSEAVMWYERAAKANNAVALYNLAVMLDRGAGVAQDWSRAAVLYEKAAKAGMPAALINLGVLHENGTGVPKNPRRAIELYSRAAEMQQLMGLTNLAVMYQYGREVERDIDRAISLNARAAGLGSTQACYALYRIHRFERDRRDLRRAEEALLKAAELGDFGALNELTAMLNDERQKPLTLRTEELFRRLEQSASQGSVPSMIALADYFDRGWLTPIDRAQARKWLERAAERDSPVGKFHLARYLAEGWGGPSDKARAFAIWQAGEVAGDSDAKLSVANALLTGTGIARDIAGGERRLKDLIEKGHPRARAALAHFVAMGTLPAGNFDAAAELRRLAETGDSSAQFALAYLLEDGRLVPKDLSAAREWYARSAQQGNDWAAFRQSTMVLLDPSSGGNREWALRKLLDLDRSGFCRAQLLLGMSYITGEVFAPDFEKAESFLRRAKANPSCEDEHRIDLYLGMALLMQTGARSEGIRLLEAAASHSVAEAEGLLGFAYETGNNVAVDLYRARSHYRRASSGGVHLASYRLAQMMINGSGGPADIPGATKILGTIPREKLLELVQSQQAK